MTIILGRDNAFKRWMNGNFMMRSRLAGEVETYMKHVGKSAADFFFGRRVELHGQENLPEKGVMIAPNHVSYLDPVVLACFVASPLYFIVGSKFKNTWLGNMLEWDGHYVVNGNGIYLRNYAEKALQEGNLVIFPEGKLGVEGKLECFKDGAEKLARILGADIFPASIIGTGSIWPRDKALPQLVNGSKVHVRFGKRIDSHALNLTGILQERVSELMQLDLKNR
jgi:1-acyl-sn-glycerol-3-phosphate acyltransferase